MVAGCGANCMKYTLFFFNLIFFLAGLCLVGIGAATMVMMDSVVSNMDKDTLTMDPKQVVTILAIVLMVTGFILMGICFFGCCGAIKEVKCMLGTYALLIGIVIMGELAVVIVMFVYKNKLDTSDDLVTVLNNEMRKNVRKYRGEGEDNSMDALQRRGQCCGADSYMDFKQKADDWVDKKKYKVPMSCCILRDKDGDIEKDNLRDPKCPKQPTLTNSYIGTPCVSDSIFKGIISLIFTVIVGTIFGLIAIELIGLIFAICLIRMMGDPRAVPV